MRLLATTVLALMIGLFLQAEPTDATRIDKLIAGLEDDDAEARDRAAKELEAVGESAIPALRKAMPGATAEGKARIARLLRDLGVEAVLNRPENAALKSQVADVAAADSWKKVELIHAWVAGLPPTAEPVDTLLELAACDPGGHPGEFAFEALNWACAAREVEDLDRTLPLRVPEGMRTQWDFMSGLFGSRIEATPEARTKLETEMLPYKYSGGWHPGVLELCEAGRAAGVRWRVEDRTGKVRFETPEEALASWTAWWTRFKLDRFALMDIRRMKLPSCQDLTRDDLEEWTDSLCSEELRRARVARAVLRELPDALVPEFRKRAEAEAAPQTLREFAERLSLRHAGRVLFLADRLGRRRLFVMNLDGSGWKPVSGDGLSIDSGWTWRGRDLAVFSAETDVEHKYGVYGFDLTGAAAPRRWADIEPKAQVVSNRDCTMAAVFVINRGEISLADPESKGLRQVVKAGACQPEWSPDGTRLAWGDTLKHEIHVFDTHGGIDRAFPGCSFDYGRMEWSPDGKALAFSQEERVAGREERFAGKILDLSSGTLKEASYPTDQACVPDWSRDGKAIAFGVQDLDDASQLRIGVEIRGRPWGESKLHWIPAGLVENRTAKADFDASPKWVRWSMDGHELFVENWADADSAYVLDVASGEWKTAPSRKVWNDAVPGGEWIVDEIGGDIFLVDRDGTRRINLTESPETEWSLRFLPER